MSQRARTWLHAAKFMSWALTTPYRKLALGLTVHVVHRSGLRLLGILAQTL